MRELEKGRARKGQTHVTKHQRQFFFRYLPDVAQAVCKEEDALRQKPLGLENMALPFSILVGAFLLRLYLGIIVCYYFNQIKYQKNIFSIFVLLLEYPLVRCLGRGSKLSDKTVSITGSLNALKHLLDSHELDPVEKFLKAERILASGRHSKT